MTIQNLSNPILSLHRVGEGGEVALVAANLPYSNLQWTRRFSDVGDFAVTLACACPVEWPGRYIVTLDGRAEVGVVEKADASEADGGASCELSGRFAECLWDRYQIGEGEESRGSSWRQAVTAALKSWHMPDIPALTMGEGTEEPKGRSYVVTGKAGDSAMELVYSVASSNAHRPLVSYDRDSGGGFTVSLLGGIDRTRSQSDNPLCIFALSMATVLDVSMSGDYSVACSTVRARAEVDRGEQGKLSATADVAVPGFDPSTMWQARAQEDVSSLLGEDETPTAQNVGNLGKLRAYDHMPELAIDCSSVSAGYMDWWDLGDIVEVEMPSVGMTAASRVEEVREVHKPEGMTVEVTVGNKHISRLARAMNGRR